MVDVLASTGTVRELRNGLVRRRADGLHARDEWHDDVYVLTSPYTPEQGQVVARIAAHLLALSDALGLCLAAPAAIGTPGHQCRVPAIVVFDPGMPRTTPASLSTAELVVEVVEAGVPGGERLDFYARWRVREVLEVNLDERTLRLHRSGIDGWEPTAHSQVLGFDLEGDAIVSLRGHERMPWPQTSPV
jgi:hypothetical protein